MEMMNWKPVQTESDLKNYLSFWEYYVWLKNIALNIFEWKNLPPTIPEYFIESVLFERGQIVFFNNFGARFAAVVKLHYLMFELIREYSFGPSLCHANLPFLFLLVLHDLMKTVQFSVADPRIRTFFDTAAFLLAYLSALRRITHLPLLVVYSPLPVFD